MERGLSVGLALCLALMGIGIEAGAHRADLPYTPSVFNASDKTVVPIDIQQIEMALKFDVGAKTAVGRSVFRFHQETSGNAMVDLVPSPTGVWLDGKALGSTGAPTVDAPLNATTVRAVSEASEPGMHILEIEFPLPSDEITFSETGVRIGFFMDDVSSDRGFLERYAPSNLEYDAFEMDVTVSLSGATAQHRLFTNGRTTKFADNQWRVSYPAYFTTSSFYFHLTDADLFVEEAIYQGKEQPIPITVYSNSQSLTTSGMKEAKEVLAELENTYGPYTHSSLTIYVTSGGGGMEHCGATMTSLWALGHEITHSWFARGVMPANGNAGWIDEAVASWRDDGYPTPAGGPTGSPVNLGGFAEYKRTTPYSAYSKGADLIANFDYLFKSQGGMKTLLNRFFGDHQKTAITTEKFKDYLVAQTAQNLDEIFERYVYGRGIALPEIASGTILKEVPRIRTHHPRPYTREERALYR